MPFVSDRTMRTLVISVACLLNGFSGCQRTVIYSPGKVPVQYLATGVRHAKRLDLSRLAQVSVDSQKILPGDVLLVSIVTGLETEDQSTWPPIRVSNQGSIDLPIVGSVDVAGLDLDQAERVIRDESIQRGYFRAPNVSVAMNHRRNNMVTVTGAVNDPGVKELAASGCDLFTAVVAAGGLSDNASTVVEIRHPAKPASVVQPASYARSASAAGSEQVDLADPQVVERDLRLPDGSVVMVMPQPEQAVQVIGLVKEPAQVKMPEDHDMRLLDAIAQAGGLTIQVANKVRVIRRVPGSEEPIVIQTTIRAAKSNGQANLRLAAGDVVSVEETPITFSVEMLRSFIRFGFSSSIPGL